MANKIKFGLSNVHYAVATIANDGTATYGSTKPILGGVNLSLEPEGEMTPFYADNVVYYVSSQNSGYTGSAEFALIPASFREDVLGDIKDSKNVYFEDADAPTVHFALLFQFEGDESATKHVMYNCTASRAPVASETKGDTITPGTEAINIVAGAVKNSVLNKNVVKSYCDDATSSVYAGWFGAVYTGTAAT